MQGKQNGLLDFLRRSSQRIATEARSLTEELKNVVDMVQGSNVYFMLNCGKPSVQQEAKKANNSRLYQTTTEVVRTTTEEESNAILRKQNDSKQVPQNLEEDKSSKNEHEILVEMQPAMTIKPKLETKFSESIEKDSTEPSRNSDGEYENLKQPATTSSFDTSNSDSSETAATAETQNEETSSEIFVATYYPASTTTSTPEEATKHPLLMEFITTIPETETEPSKEHIQSTFNSLLLSKIQETAKNYPQTTTETTITTQQPKRHKRDILEFTTLEPAILQEVAPSDLSSQCISRMELEQHKQSEKMHLDGLQKELEKLEELIQVLHEQQKILDSMSEMDEKYYESLNQSIISNHIEEQRRLVELLETLNVKLSNTSDFDLQTKTTEDDNSTIELNQLKNDVEELKRMVEKLPFHSQEVERKLSKEIERQQMEIFSIRKAVKHLQQTGRNFSTARQSESHEHADPKFIQQQISSIQHKIDEMLARHREPVVGEHRTNPEVHHLTVLQKEVEQLKQLIERSLKVQLENPDDVDAEEVRKLEEEERQLLEVRKVIEDIIRGKMEKKGGGDMLQATLHHVHPHILLPKHSKPSERHEEMKEKTDKFFPTHTPQMRSSDSNGLKKLIKGLDDDDEDEDDDLEIQSKLLDLQRQLKTASKKKKKNDVEAQIRSLEQKVKQLENAGVQSKSLPEDEAKASVKLLQRILQELGKSRDIEETDTERELRRLAEAINRLRPKDDDLAFETEGKNEAPTAQFQTMLNKLIAQQNARPPQESFAAPPAGLTPQQMSFLMNKFTQIAPQPVKSDYQQPFLPRPVFYQPPGKDLFRDYPSTYQPNHGVYQTAGQQQLDANQEATVVDAAPYAKQKIDDLKQQIYSLQGAIANLDSPSYVKRPEDEEAIYNLEHQIDELKGVVSGLEGYEKPRVRRGDEEGARFIEDLFGNLPPGKKEHRERSAEALREKLKDLAKQLGGTGSGRCVYR